MTEAWWWGARRQHTEENALFISWRKSKIDKLVSMEEIQSSLIFHFFYVRENRAYGFRVF